MGMKKCWRILLLLISPFFSSLTSAQQMLGQSILINTNFTQIYGKPTWLLEIRDEESKKVSPYLYEIRNNDNYWIAFTFGHTYRIIASSVTFGPFAKIKNFCHLENGIISGQSYMILLKGEMSPDKHSYQCYVEKYQSAGLPIFSNQ